MEACPRMTVDYDEETKTVGRIEKEIEADGCKDKDRQMKRQKHT